MPLHRRHRSFRERRQCFEHFASQRGYAEDLLKPTQRFEAGGQRLRRRRSRVRREHCARPRWRLPGWLSFHPPHAIEAGSGAALGCSIRHRCGEPLGGPAVDPDGAVREAVDERQILQPPERTRRPPERRPVRRPGAGIRATRRRDRAGWRSRPGAGLGDALATRDVTIPPGARCASPSTGASRLLGSRRIAGFDAAVRRAPRGAYGDVGQPAPPPFSSPSMNSSIRRGPPTTRRIWPSSVASPFRRGGRRRSSLRVSARLRGPPARVEEPSRRARGSGRSAAAAPARVPGASAGRRHVRIQELAAAQVQVLLEVVQDQQDVLLGQGLAD